MQLISSIRISRQEYWKQWPIPTRAYTISRTMQMNEGQKFALNTQLYECLAFLNDASFQAQYSFPDYHFDLQKFFGEENFRVLSSSSVNVSTEKVTDNKGNTFKGGDMVMSTDYPP